MNIYFGGENLKIGMIMMLEISEIPRKIQDILTFRKEEL